MRDVPNTLCSKICKPQIEYKNWIQSSCSRIEERVHRGWRAGPLCHPGWFHIPQGGGLLGLKLRLHGSISLYPLAFRIHLWSWCCCLLGQEVAQLQLHMFHIRKMEESGAVFTSGEQAFPQPALAVSHFTSADTATWLIFHHPFCPMMDSCPEEPLPEFCFIELCMCSKGSTLHHSNFMAWSDT